MKIIKRYARKLWKKSSSKEGFTLVELIVVLVIMTILSAITVPALLGWIDRAKEKQIMMEARSAYLAAQTLASEEYALPNPDKTNITEEAIKELSGVKGSITEIVFKEDSFVIQSLTYTSPSGDVFVYKSELSGGS